MHRTWILQVIFLYFKVEPIRFRNFRRSFEVGDAGRSCAGSGLANGQDDLPARLRLMESTRGVLSFPKHPHFPEVEKNSPQNAASGAMVPAGGW